MLGEIKDFTSEHYERSKFINFILSSNSNGLKLYYRDNRGQTYEFFRDWYVQTALVAITPFPNESARYWSPSMRLARDRAEFWGTLMAIQKDLDCEVLLRFIHGLMPHVDRCISAEYREVAALSRIKDDSVSWEMVPSPTLYGYYMSHLSGMASWRFESMGNVSPDARQFLKVPLEQALAGLKEKTTYAEQLTRQRVREWEYVLNSDY